MNEAWLAFAVGLVLGLASFSLLAKVGKWFADSFLPARHLALRGVRRRQNTSKTARRQENTEPVSDDK